MTEACSLSEAAVRREWRKVLANSLPESSFRRAPEARAQPHLSHAEVRSTTLGQQGGSHQVARLERALPGERLGDDLAQIVALRPPAELGADAVGARHDRRRVAGPPARDHDREIDARDLLHHVDDLEDRVALAVAAVEGQALAAAAQVFEGDHVGVGKVADLDIVAHARAVLGRIIRAEHFYARTVAKGGL